MSPSARARGNIRTTASLRREATAKRVAEELLKARGFRVKRTRDVQNRYLLDVTDPVGRERTLWFKLGWNPGKHGTSAVQIAMLKKGSGGRAPSKFTDAEVLERVTAKLGRGAATGVSDLLLFSLDARNETPIACLIVPLARVREAFEECLRLDARRTRKGASPVLWVKGTKPATMELQRRVEKYATENLLRSGPQFEDRPGDDAINDFAPEPALVGNPTPERKFGLLSRFPRDPRIRENAISRAQGRCELCDQAGFLMPNGKRYLESHHIQALGDEGPDTENNVIALCANDHRAAHFSTESEALAEKMKKILAKKLRGTRAASARG